MNQKILYAAIELDRRKGAVYRSSDSGGSWTKMSTQSLVVQVLTIIKSLLLLSFDRIYLMNVRALVSEDGGKTFYTMSEANKHSDNHSLTFKKNDPNYLLFGTDGGI